MYGQRLLLAVLGSLLIHALVPFLVPRREHREVVAPRKVSPRPVPVAVVREVRRAAEEPLPPPPEPQAPPRRPEPPPPPEKTRKPPVPPRQPSSPPPEPRAAPPEEAPKAQEPKKPAPFVLSNVALQGTVAVQTGAESNLFGDPKRDATGFQKGVDRPGGGTTTGGEEAREARKPVVKPPKALNQVKGTYPEAHRDLGRVVRVELLLTVSPDGEVTDAQVRKGDLPAFEEEARRTVRRLRFQPATRDGIPIAYQVAWTVVFLPEP